MLSSTMLAQSSNTVEIIVWAVIIVAAFIIEAETVNLVSIWFGVAGVPALICAAFGLDLYIQLIVFFVLAVVLVFSTRPLAKKLNKGATKTNADRLVDMIGIVTQEIPVDGKGEVAIEFQKWSAVSAQNKMIAVGSRVVIKAILGNKLKVDLIEEIEIQ